MLTTKPNIVIKYCFEGEIHKAFSPPLSLSDLQNTLSSIFGDRLPKNYTINYRDADQDLITISSEAEYESMLHYDRPMSYSQSSLKIFVLPGKQDSTKTPKSHSTANSNKKEDSFQQVGSPAKSANGSFEVVDDSSQSIIAGHISEISLSFADDNKERSGTKANNNSSADADIKIDIPEYVLREEGVSGDAHMNDMSESEDQRSKKEESSEGDFERDMSAERSLSFRPDEEEANLSEDEASVNSHNETIEKLEARVAVLKKQLDLSGSFGHDVYERRAISEKEDEESQQENSEMSLQCVMRNLANLREKFRRDDEDYKLEDSILSREVDSALDEIRNKQRTDEVIQRLQAARERMISTRNALIYKDYVVKSNADQWARRDERPKSLFYNEKTEKVSREAGTNPMPFRNQDVWMNWVEQRENIDPQQNKPFIANHLMPNAERLAYRPLRFDNQEIYKPLMNKSENLSEPVEDSGTSLGTSELSLRKPWELEVMQPRDYRSSFYYSYDSKAQNERYNQGFEASESFQSPDSPPALRRFYRDKPEQSSQDLKTPASADDWWNPQPLVRGNFAMKRASGCAFCRNPDQCQHKRDIRRTSIELGTDYSGSSLKSVSVRNLLEIPNSSCKDSKEISEVSPASNYMENFCTYVPSNDFASPSEPFEEYLNYRENRVSDLGNDDILNKGFCCNDFAYQVMTGIRTNLHYLSGIGRGVVYKTVYIENIGNKPWRRCLVKSVGNIGGRSVELVDVKVGGVVMVTLEMRGLFATGAYSSQWRLIHENANGMVELIGEPFSVEFIIDGRREDVIGDLESDNDKSNREIRDMDDSGMEMAGKYREGEEDAWRDEWDDDRNLTVNEVTVNEGIEDVGTDAVLAKYQKYREEIAKVWEIRRWFPEDDLEGIITFINERPEMSGDEAVMAYRTVRLEMMNQNEEMIYEDY